MDVNGAGLDTWEGRSVERWRTRWRVPELHVFRHVASTNDVARRRAEAGAPDGTVVLADEQTAGRGRRGRAWLAAPGQAVLLSVLYRVREPSGALPLRVGMAVADTVDGAITSVCQVKWPNDILAESRKIAGVLCESASASGGGWMIAGVGLNVLQSRSDFPPELRDTATSMAAEAGRCVDRADTADRLVAALTTLTDPAGPLGPGELDRLRRRDALRGRRIAVDGTVGRSEGLAPDGALRLRLDDGRLRHLYAGTVRLLHQTSEQP